MLWLSWKDLPPSSHLVSPFTSCELDRTYCITVSIHESIATSRCRLWRIWTVVFAFFDISQALQKPLLLRDYLVDGWRIEWRAPSFTAICSRHQGECLTQGHCDKDLGTLENQAFVNCQIGKSHGIYRSVGSTHINLASLNLGWWERLTWMRVF